MSLPKVVLEKFRNGSSISDLSIEHCVCEDRIKHWILLAELEEAQNPLEEGDKDVVKGSSGCNDKV